MSSSMIVSGGQRVVISTSLRRPQYISIEILRVNDRNAQPRFLNVWVHRLDEFISLLQAERDALVARDAGGDDA
jgi:hypothetical protein